MRVLFLYVSTNMCRDGDLWFYDEGMGSVAACLRDRGHGVAFRMVSPHDTIDGVADWVDAEREPHTLIVYMTSLHVSAFGHDIPDTFHVVSGLKHRTGLPTAFVGLWATMNTEALLERDEIDFAGRGEMDDALPDLCDALEAGKATHGIPNFWSRVDGEPVRNELRPFIADLGTRPFPARDLLPLEKQANERDGILTYVAARGCPVDCNFCANHVIRRMYDASPARFVRVKPVDYVIDEVKHARSTHPSLKAVFFHDDIFGIGNEWTREILERWGPEVGLPWGCNLVMSQATPEFVSSLAAAGCRHVQIGVESGCAFIRNEVLDKRIEESLIHDVLARCKEAGIMVKLYAMMGLPEETRARFVESVKGFARFCPDMIQIQVWEAHEGSDLLAHDPEQGEKAHRHYDPKGDREAWRLKFYFRYFHRYVALYHLLQGRVRQRPILGRLARAFVTLSVRIPFAPHLLLPRNWDGRRRWPARVLESRWVRKVGRWLMPGLLDEAAALERRLAADYILPADIAAQRDGGWQDDLRRDRRRTRLEVMDGAAS